MRLYLVACLLMGQFLLSQAHGSELVTDNFAQLVSTSVQQSIQPSQESEIAQAVASFKGKVSIGGAR